MKLTFHGHSCFSIENQGKKIIIDPFLKGNPLAKLSPQDLTQLDAILITHGHGDHLGDALEIAQNTNAIIIAPNELAVYCQSKGAQVHPMHIGGAYNFSFGKVKLTQALHGSAVIDEAGIQYTGNPCGYLLFIGNKIIYHAGDTGLFGDMELIGRLHPLDVALLPIGDNFVMGIDDGVEAVKLLKPKLTIPMHYNTFDLIKQDPQDFQEKVTKSGYDCLILGIEDSIEI